MTPMRMRFFFGASLLCSFLPACAGDASTPAEAADETNIGHATEALGATGTSASLLAATSPDDAYEKKLSLGKLGELALVADSRLTLPDAVSGRSEGEARLHVGLEHRLRNGYDYAPISVIVSGRSVDVDTLHEGTNDLGALQIDVSGILAEGLPEYLEHTKAIDDLRASGFELAKDPADGSHATLTRHVTVAISHDVAQRAADLRVKVDDARRAIGALEADLGAAERDARLAEARAAYATLRSEKEALVRSLTNLEVPCFPEFERTIRFPIYEWGGSAGSGSQSASAGLGVSGDVVLRVTPKCGIAIGSAATIDAFVSADVKLLSHGYFGARAEGRATSGPLSLSAEFDSAKYGRYVSAARTLGDREKEVIGNVISSTATGAEDVAEVGLALVDALRKVDLSSKVVDAVIKNLIGEPGSLAPMDKICRLMAKAGGGGDADMICKYVGKVLPARPTLVLPPFIAPPLPPLPPHPGGQCLPALPKGPCVWQQLSIPQPPHPCMQSCSTDVRYPCPTIRKPGRMCTKTISASCPSTCPSDPITTANWFPPACDVANASVDEANRGREQVCAAIDHWEGEVRNVESQIDAINAHAHAEYDRQTAALQKDFDDAVRHFEAEAANIAKYQSTELIYATASSLLRRVAILSDAEQHLASELLKGVWKVDAYGRQIQDRTDLARSVLGSGFLEDISLSISGSARVAFAATAHILEIQPTLRHTAGISLGADGKPQLTQKVTFSAHGDAQKDGTFGTLDIADLILHADIKGYVGQNEVLTWTYDHDVLSLGTIKGRKIESKVDKAWDFSTPLGSVDVPGLGSIRLGEGIAR